MHDDYIGFWVAGDNAPVCKRECDRITPENGVCWNVDMRRIFRWQCAEHGEHSPRSVGNERQRPLE